MQLRGIALAFGSGLAAFLVVGVIVAEIGTTYTEFSVLVGVPAGLLAAVAVVVTVLLGYGESVPSRRRRVANTFGAFGLLLLVGLVVPVGAVGLPVATVTLWSGVGAGVVAVGLYVRSWRHISR